MQENTYENVYTDGMHFTSEGYSLLSQITKWTKFLSILGFVFIGLFVIIILSAGIVITSTNAYADMTDLSPYNPGVFSWFYALIYLVVLGIYAIPVYYLYKFSVKTKNALLIYDVDLLTDGLRFLKKHYAFIGILAIIGLVLYFVGIICALFMFAGYMS